MDAFVASQRNDADALARELKDAPAELLHALAMAQSSFQRFVSIDVRSFDRTALVRCVDERAAGALIGAQLRWLANAVHLATRTDEEWLAFDLIFTASLFDAVCAYLAALAHWHANAERGLVNATDVDCVLCTLGRLDTVCAFFAHLTVRSTSEHNALTPTQPPRIVRVSGARYSFAARTLIAANRTFINVSTMNPFFITLALCEAYRIYQPQIEEFVAAQSGMEFGFGRLAEDQPLLNRALLGFRIDGNFQRGYLPNMYILLRQSLIYYMYGSATFVARFATQWFGASEYAPWLLLGSVYYLSTILLSTLRFIDNFRAVGEEQRAQIANSIQRGERELGLVSLRQEVDALRARINAFEQAQIHTDTTDVRQIADAVRGRSPTPPRIGRRGGGGQNNQARRAFAAAAPLP